ncbi:hypothetical protein LSI54_12835 [Nesterenkonia sp. AY15]|uniref:hypothetical protein n=1 Tax=Nesterenkonia sp. AY15 TaxID=2901139 RepID=UPI001F4CCFF7|nr:hypothetical protein [Nesterenkonia sp. AY15]MCH8572233.1 hypothetical protein [Nesterenkonia sp. AY15]
MTVQGHAAFHLEHNAHGKNGTRADRRNLLKECMRHLNEKDVTRQALRNSNIVVDDTHLNEAFVNDGHGGFRHAKSVKEVLDFGDGRIKRVRRKISENQMTVDRFVVHLPKSMCVEVPNYYPRINSDGSERIDPVTGQPMSRSRWVARDHQEAMEYLHHAANFLIEHVIPGKHDAVHGWATNFDESTPHLQLMADPFARDPKASDPEILRTEYSQAYRSHREVRYSAGPRSGQQIDGRAKMRNYQSNMRDHMIALGYPVEKEVNERHGQSLPPEEFKLAKDAEAAASATLAGVRDLERGYRTREQALDAWAAEIVEQEQHLDQMGRQIQSQTQQLRDTAEVQAQDILSAAMDQGQQLLMNLRERITETNFGAWIEEHYPEVIDEFSAEIAPRAPSPRRTRRKAPPSSLPPARQRHLSSLQRGDRSYGD